jgi:hypothetical protein
MVEGRYMKKTDTEAVPVSYESISAWSKRSGMKLGAIYARLASGDLRAIKVGRRTLIDVQHGLEWLDANRWKPSGPAAKRSATR